uniref:Phosphatidylethanolamine-binding protein n=1 Tax=viral metagenome TaxID=1070528 RepID=A0A6C0HLG5_9ZZZZ
MTIRKSYVSKRTRNYLKSISKYNPKVKSINGKRIHIKHLHPRTLKNLKHIKLLSNLHKGGTKLNIPPQIIQTTIQTQQPLLNSPLLISYNGITINSYKFNKFNKPQILTQFEASMIPHIIISAQGKTLLLLYDPDAPNGEESPSNNKPFMHMAAIYDNGKLSKTLVNYMGPSPPAGTHNYIFKLFSLLGIDTQTQITLPEGKPSFDYYENISKSIKKLKNVKLIGQLSFKVKAQT